MKTLFIISFLLAFFCLSNLFAQNNACNFALSSNGSTVTAISEGTYQGITHYGTLLIDGDLNTYWASQWSMPAWVTIDFHQVRQINTIAIMWGTHQQGFTISLSNDGINWTTVIASPQSGNIEGATSHEIYTFNSTSARYLKINITSTSAPANHIFQAAIQEIEAYYTMPSVASSANGSTVSSISEGTYQGITHYGYLLNDGDLDSFWASQWSMPAWVIIDFHQVQQIDLIAIMWGTHQQEFSISLSNDGISWSTAVYSQLSSNLEGISIREVYSINSTSARYLKIDITSTSAPANHIFQSMIQEIEAYTLNCDSPITEFSGTPNNIAVGGTVAFTDLSTNTPSNWSWSFGDGGTSTIMNPTHVYSTAGTYTVSLTATNVFGSNTATKNNYIVVNNNTSAPIANFIGTPINVAVGGTVGFTDLSTNFPNGWSWNFGDGGTSTVQNPTHVYNTAGNYTVSLTATNVYGNNTITKNSYINVGGGVVQSCALDISFGNNGLVTTGFDIGDGGDYATCIALQNDGKIVATGYNNTSSSPYSSFELARYNTNGSLDANFGDGGKVTTALGSSYCNYNGAKSIGIQSDGKIVIAGSTCSINTESDFAIGRYYSNGTLDNSFGTNGIVITDNFHSGAGYSSDNAYALAIQSDGKIIVAGATWYSGSDFAIARYNSNGSLDASFGSGGKVVTSVGAYDEAYAVVIQNDGKILVGGESADDFSLVRYNTNGSLDNSFGIGGMVTTDINATSDAINSLAIQSDGKIVAAGSCYISGIYNIALARYNANGSLDNSFGSGGKVTSAIGSQYNNSVANSVLIQNDGKIIVGGYSFDGSYDFTIVRYNSNGTIDNTFCNFGITTTDFGNNENIADLAMQADGKIIAAGTTYTTGNVDFALARYVIANYSVELNNETHFSIFPNPSSNFITIENLITTPQYYNVTIMNMQGQAVVNKKVFLSTAQTIDVSNLSNGLYILILQSDSENYMNKIAIQR